MSSAQEQRSPDKAQLQIMVVDAKPYHYRDPETGQMTGFDAETAKELLTLAGFKPRFRLVSWSRAVLTAERVPNSLIMPYSRSTEREERVVWLYPLRETRYGIFGKGANSLNTLKAEVKNSETVVHCELGGIQCSLLAKAGVPEEKIVPFPDTNFERMVNLSLRGRVKYFIAETDRIEAMVAREGFSADLLPLVAELPETVVDYLAINKDTDPAIIARLEKAADTMIARLNRGN